jgi:peptidoglycan/xylan/chitin deacetylase (PgdA/CDA1 family)
MRKKQIFTEVFAMRFSRLFKIFTVVFILSMACGSDAVLNADEKGLPVLLYHHLMPERDMALFKNNGLVISKELFTAHMKYLYDNGYHTVTAAELSNYLFNNSPLPAKSVMITFDDGYMSNYMFAGPILRQYGFKAVLFTITACIQTKDQEYRTDKIDMMSWMQVAASADVFETGSHTNNMHNAGKSGKTALMEALPALAGQDIATSLKRVSNNKIFAYPMGQYNQSIIDMLKQQGVEMAFTTREGYVTSLSDAMQLKRITIYSDCDVSRFAGYVSAKTRF